MRKSPRDASGSDGSKRPPGTKPVSFDAAGRRVRWLVLVGLFLTGACLAYLLAMLVSRAAS